MQPARPFHRLLSAGVAALALLAGTALAQQSTRLVVPFAPGGAQDVIGRYLSDRLTQRLGQPVVVENKAGAGGIIAADLVAKATADGHTLLLATGGAISVGPHLQEKLPYAPLKDLVAVAMVADTPMTLATGAQSGYKTVAEVIAAAKASPGTIAFASTGPGTLSHLTGELFAQTTGTQLLHTPYKGAAPAITDLIGGQLPLIVTSTASIAPHLATGKVRVLGTFTARRAFPDVPTMGEAGIKGLDVPVWVGVMAPARTPAAVLEKLGTELLAICRLPETRAHFDKQGVDTTCADAATFAKVIKEDHERWGRVIRTGNISINK